MSATKYAALVPISHEVALDHGLIEPTDEERAEMAKAWVRQQDYDRHLDAWTLTLADITDPVATAVLEIHHRSYSGYCPVCDDWPCQTADAVTAIIGHPSPSY
jgi:hypothetical protein